MSGFQRVELIKVLGVTISRKFSVAKHVDELLTTHTHSHYLHFAHCDSTACLLKHFKLHSRPLWLISSATLPLHGGVSPQRMIECVWSRSFDDAIDSDIVMNYTSRTFNSICTDADGMVLYLLTLTDL